MGTSAGARRVGPWTASWLPVLLIFVGACLGYAVNLDQPPLHDELYHVLAGQGLLATGEPRLGDGLYTRGLAWTWLVAQSMALFGENLAAARLPAVVTMAALVALLFVWLRREAGPGAAWLASLLFAASPFAIELARYCRFYALQMLLFLAAAWCLHAVVSARPRSRVVAGAGVSATLLFLAAATTFQPATLIGAAGLGLWAVPALALPWLLDPGVPRRLRFGFGLAAVAAVVVVATAAVLGGLAEAVWGKLRSHADFQLGVTDDLWYYHRWISLYYPTLWPATGLLALAALARGSAQAARPNFAWLALAVYATAFVTHSLAGSKSLRYLAYAQPFLFALWGLGLAAALGPLGGWLRDRLAPALTPRLGGSRLLAHAAIAAGLAVLVAANPAWLRSVLLLAGRPAPGERSPADWSLAAPTLAPLVASAAVVVTSEDVSAQYYLGRFDINVSASKLDEVDNANTLLGRGQEDAPEREFSLDPRTGRPVISTAASLRRVLGCYPSGLIVGSEEDWGKAHLVDAELAAIITATARRVALPPRSGVYAYAWGAPPPQQAAAAIDRPGQAGCEGLPRPATVR